MKPDTYQWAVEQGPIGVWQTNSGSATVLMSNVLTLSPDGTGTVAYYATLTDDAEFGYFRSMKTIQLRRKMMTGRCFATGRIGASST